MIRSKNWSGTIKPITDKNKHKAPSISNSTVTLHKTEYFQFSVVQQSSVGSKETDYIDKDCETLVWLSMRLRVTISLGPSSLPIMKLRLTKAMQIKTLLCLSAMTEKEHIGSYERRQIF